MIAKNWDHQQWTANKSSPVSAKKPLTKVTNLSGTSKSNLTSGLRPGLMKVSEKKKTEEEEEAERLEKLIEEKLNGIDLDNADYILSSSEDENVEKKLEENLLEETQETGLGFGLETFARNNIDSLLGNVSLFFF